MLHMSGGATAADRFLPSTLALLANPRR